MKVMVIVGTRPEIIRLSCIIDRLRSVMDCVFVHTGQNFSYELGEIFYSDLNLAPPDYYLSAVGSNLSETLGNIIIKVDQVLEKEKPDAVLVLGDTNSALSVIPAKRRKIPIFHYEAGNRCFDQRVPEEINRKIVDHTSDINLTYSQIAKDNLLGEGFPMDRVFCIGSPMLEVLTRQEEKIHQSNVLVDLGIEKGKYFVLSAHREENVDNELKMNNLVLALERIHKKYEYPVVFSVHPRTEMRLQQYGLKMGNNTILCKPFSFSDYIALQKDSFCVLSDSGTITEEASILGFDAINLRDTHERLEGTEAGAVMMTGFSATKIEEALYLLKDSKSPAGKAKIYVNDYMHSGISDKLAKIIISYTEYVNQKVWLKNA